MRAIFILIVVVSGCAGSRYILPEGQRGSVAPRTVQKITDESVAFSTAIDELTARGYTIQVLDRQGGLISSQWSPWDCFSDSQKQWGALLVGRSGNCQKQASISIRDSRAIVRASARICTFSANAYGNQGPESCRDNDSPELAERLIAEQTAIANAIELLGTRAAREQISPNALPVSTATVTFP